MIYIIQGEQQLKENLLPVDYWYTHKFPIAVKTHKRSMRAKTIDQFDIAEGLDFKIKYETN